MNIYEKFREKLHNSIPIPTPSVKDKIELEILATLITPEEAEIASNVSPQPENLKTIAERAGLDPQVLGPILEEIVEKGVIFKVYLDDPLYCLFPMMPGIYEFQVGRLTPEQVNLFEKYYAEGHGEAVFKNKMSFSRTIALDKSVPAETNVLTFEEVDHIIDNASSITLAPCLCRTNKKLIGEGCDAPADDICILFDSWAEYYARKGLGRAVDKAEAKKALERAEKAGLVHVTMNVKVGGLYICNCCGCCCALLRGITQLNIPTSITKSNFRATVSEKDCVGCNVCVDACHVKAIRLEDSLAVISEESCIGCGLCVSACPYGALAMERKEQIDATPETIPDLLGAIAAGRAD